MDDLASRISEYVKGSLNNTVARPEPTNPLQQKMESLHPHTEAAVDHLIEWLTRDKHALIQLAKGRHIHGHYLYEDKFLYEYTPSRLRAEASEELADAIVYIARMLEASSGALGKMEK